MAKINEQIIHIKLSQLLRDNEPNKDILTENDLVVLLEALKSMVGDAVLIELD